MLSKTIFRVFLTIACTLYTFKTILRILQNMSSMALLWRFVLLIIMAATVCSTSLQFNPRKETFRHPSTLEKTYCYKFCTQGKYRNGAKYCWEKCPTYMAYFEGLKAGSNSSTTPPTCINVVWFYLVTSVGAVFFVIVLIQSVVLAQKYCRRKPTRRQPYEYFEASDMRTQPFDEEDEADEDLAAVPEVPETSMMSPTLQQPANDETPCGKPVDTRNSSTVTDIPRVTERPD